MYIHKSTDLFLNIISPDKNKDSTGLKLSTLKNNQWSRPFLQLFSTIAVRWNLFFPYRISCEIELAKSFIGKVQVSLGELGFSRDALININTNMNQVGLDQNPRYSASISIFNYPNCILIKKKQIPYIINNYASKIIPKNFLKIIYLLQTFVLSL